jgi:hypothetical protein
MTISLTNFGVPLGGGAGRGGILMPKIKNRFRVIVTNFGIPSGSIALTQQVVSVGRPNVNFNPQTLHSYNSVAYYAGKAEWEPITLTVRDDVTNSVSSLVGAQLQKQMNFFDQTVPLAASNYKFGMLIHSLDGGDDTVLEEWVAEGCFLATVNYQTYEYSAADAMTIEMSVRCDNFTLSDGLMPINPTLISGPFVG